MLDRLDSEYRRKYRIAWVFKKAYLTERDCSEKRLSGHGDWFDEMKQVHLKDGVFP